MRNSLAIDFLKDIARENNDITLNSVVDDYIHNPDNYTTFEHFLLQAIEVMSLSHKMTREALIETISTRTSPIYVNADDWKDMNS